MHRILVATDDILMEKAIEKIISKENNFKVISNVNNASEIVDLCKSQSVDIIFLDSQTKYVNLLKLCDNISNIDSSIAIYVIAHPNNTIHIWQESREYIKDIIERPVTYKRIKKAFESYSTENENSVQVYIDDILKVVQNNDYQEFYFEISRLINNIYLSTNSDSIKLVSVFTYIAKKLTETRIYQEDSKNLLEIFPINESLILEKKVSEIWLFKVVDYLFQKKCIDRYPLLDNILLYINNHIKDKITLNDITDSCSISQGYLSRIFREQLNVSVMDYIHMKKMYSAKVYFYFTNDSIAEVAFKLGYNESSYFSKVFKKYEGKTVKEYKSE